MEVWARSAYPPVAKVQEREVCLTHKHTSVAQSERFRDDKDLAVSQRVGDLIAMLYSAHQNAVPEHVEKDWPVKCELVHTGQVELVELCRGRPRRRRLSILQRSARIPSK